MANKTVKTKKTYWVNILFGILLIIGGVMLAPFWGKIWADCPWKDWGYKVISYTMAVLLMIYLFGFVIKKVTKSKGTIQVLTIIEFVLLALIALGLIFSQLNVLNVPNQPSKIIGIALYIRGFIEIFRAYYYRQNSTYTYPVWWLFIAILFITFGVYLFLNSTITILMLLWALVIVLVLLGIISILYGVMVKPEKKAKNKTK